MIVTLDTSTPFCKISFIENDWQYAATWEANRDLAKGLLGYLQDELHSQGKNWEDITGLIVFRGPGSFTGLRIGVTVFNTLSYARNVPIIGAMGEHWIQDGVSRLDKGENDMLVLPEYGAEAHITTPRK